MNSKIDGNWNKIRQELEDVALVWRTTRADQSGWSHEVMQKARDLARHAPVTCASLLLVGAFVIVVLVVAG
jgi:hypothetical protein